MCFSSLCIYGVLPDSLVAVVLVPFIKNKSESVCNKNNYRPIALASVISKVLEYILFVRIQQYLYTSSSQFGFKAKHSTDLCVYLLKKTILRYHGLNSNVYCCFLDASKAFDRVNQCKLFQNLQCRGVPPYIIRILVFWYTQQIILFYGTSPYLMDSG